ncbi:thioredoxin family protein [Pseudomonas oligotrophica]|uniref:thioredoxin family protein n=1 Tax=Pseudomonas oligotrophica TaxID=2912055 RepID=UPI001F1FE62F|nr:thioredoxin family protein [Pseudomonas oligotrophica]MCF7203220.1 thioredoxin family protein [Pseudomonas oligotrophica]
MALTENYALTEPSRSEVDLLDGPTLLEFGAPWCGHCRAAQPLLEQAMGGRDSLRHLKIEDGPGRPLGRSFRVKLWPTFILLEHGVELARVVRPTEAEAIEQILGEAGR